MAPPRVPAAAHRLLHCCVQHPPKNRRVSFPAEFFVSLFCEHLPQLRMDGLGLSDGTIYIGDGRYDAPSVKKPAAAPHGTYYVPHPRQDLADTSDPESLIITKIEERDNQLSVMGEDSQMVLRTPATAADVKGADARLIERNAELAETNSHLTQQVRELKEIIAARDHRIGQLQHALNGADLEGRILMRLDEMSAQVSCLPLQREKHH